MQKLLGIVPADVVNDTGMYRVTAKSDGEPIAESSRARLVLKFGP